VPKTKRPEQRKLTKAFSLTQRTAAMLEAEAEHEGMSMSGLLERTLRLRYERMEQENPNLWRRVVTDANDVLREASLRRREETKVEKKTYVCSSCGESSNVVVYEKKGVWRCILCNVEGPL